MDNGTGPEFVSTFNKAAEDAMWYVLEPQEAPKIQLNHGKLDVEDPELPPIQPPNGALMFSLDVDVKVEKILLLAVGILDGLLTLAFMIVLASKRERRSLTNAFLYHSGLLDLVKSLFAVAFAISIRPTRITFDRQGTPKYEVMDFESDRHTNQTDFACWMTPLNAYNVIHVCTLLGTTHIVLITIFVFNILAILCTEAFAFTDDNQQALIASKQNAKAHLGGQKSRQDSGNEEEMTNIHRLLALHTAQGINGCCVLFTIGMIYMASLVLHLGPTIIAGQFDMDTSQDIFHCNLLGGEVRNYITYSMWLAIVCLAMASAIYYAVIFYRMIILNSSHRIVNLLRAGVVLATHRFDAVNETQIFTVISMYKNRARVLIALIAFTVTCYYPLFLIMLSSLKFTPQPFLYKAFRMIALANPIFNAILFLCFDNQLSCSNLMRSDDQSTNRNRVSFFNRRQAGGRVHDKEESVQSRPLVLQNESVLASNERFELLDSSTWHERVGQRLRNAMAASEHEAIGHVVINDSARLAVLNQNGKEDTSPIRIIPPNTPPRDAKTIRRNLQP